MTTQHDRLIVAQGPLARKVREVLDARSARPEQGRRVAG
jgi:hypothetical protein